MFVMSAASDQPRPNDLAVERRASIGLVLSALAVPTALYAIALVARFGAMLLVRFPLSEGSAYYVEVARNLATGRGLVIDAIWSYATPPLTLPRPAFELWQPLASIVAAVPMVVAGAEFWAAQIAFALLGALIAPLAWLIARDSARRLKLEERRVTAVAIGSGLLVGIVGPLLLFTVAPDSTLPFTLLGVAACAVMPAAVRGGRWAVVALGILAGLAYLTRTEAIYLVFAFIALAGAARVGWRALVGRGAAVAAIGALVALPWWLRNVAVFGSPLPGQISDNMFLTANEQIFAYAQPPTLAGFLGQGVATILGNIVEAVRHNAIDVLIVPLGVLSILALAALIAGWRQRHALSGSPLQALLVLGLVTFVLTSLLFPVATLWGTFEHAAGPLLVALAILAALAADAIVARVREWRSWPRSNAWLAQAALLGLTIPLAFYQLLGASSQTRAEQASFAALAQALPGALSSAGVDASAPLITDRPIWLSDSLNRAALALPDEPASDIVALARRFGAQAIVVVEPSATAARSTAVGWTKDACFMPLALGAGAGEAIGFVIKEACR